MILILVSIDLSFLSILYWWIIQYVTICIWFTSLNIMFPTFIHCIACVSLSLLFVAKIIFLFYGCSTLNIWIFCFQPLKIIWWSHLFICRLEGNFSEDYWFNFQFLPAILLRHCCFLEVAFSLLIICFLNIQNWWSTLKPIVSTQQKSGEIFLFLPLVGSIKMWTLTFHLHITHFFPQKLCSLDVRRKARERDVEYLSDKNLGLCGKETVVDFFNLFEKVVVWHIFSLYFFSWTLFHKMSVGILSFNKLWFTGQCSPVSCCFYGRGTKPFFFLTREFIYIYFWGAGGWFLAFEIFSPIKLQF